MFHRLVVLVSVLVAFSIGFLLPMAVVHAAASLDSVGARTPFSMENSLDLADYCDGSDQVDDTQCIGNWITEAKNQGKHLYVSPGTYIYSKGRAIFNGFHLQCATPLRTVFKSINNAGNLFLLTANSGVTGEPWQDISIENCGFDLNGTTVNFASVITLLGNTAPVQYVTVRGNLVYDSTQPGQMYTTDDRQRQYIVILNAEDVLVENNNLSEGGRIKVGRPGRRVVIRNNTLYNINNNAITVVDRLPVSISSDILIEGNTITNPLGSGIFFGADGQSVGTETLEVYDVTIRNNVIMGDFNTACITGTLPNKTARIYISNNTCRKTGSAGTFVAGILLNRANHSLLYTQDITVKENIIRSDIAGAYNSLGGIFVGDRFDNLCVLGNKIYDTGTAIRLRNYMINVKATGNELDGGKMGIGPTVQVDRSGNTSGCFEISSASND